MASSPGSFNSINVVGNPHGSIDERITSAGFAVSAAQGQLATALQKVGMTRTYVGEDPQSALMAAIELYTRAVAHREMLVILSREDFFVAMARSAGALQG